MTEAVFPFAKVIYFAKLSLPLFTSARPHGLCFYFHTVSQMMFLPPSVLLITLQIACIVHLSKLLIRCRHW